MPLNLREVLHENRLLLEASLAPDPKSNAFSDLKLLDFSYAHPQNFTVGFLFALFLLCGKQNPGITESQSAVELVQAISALSIPPLDYFQATAGYAKFTRAFSRICHSFLMKIDPQEKSNHL